MTAATSAVGEKDFSDPYGVPLVKHLNVRISGPSYAAVVTRALAEQRTEAEIARRWMRRGAAAEGVSFDVF